MSESWPFRLGEVRGIAASGEPQLRLFRFTYGGDTYFAEAGRALSFWSGERMSTRDLRLYAKGSAWIANRHSVDIDSSRPGEPVELGIPSTTDRRRAIEELAAAALRELGVLGRSGVGEGAEGEEAMQVEILEGLFFPSRNRHLALVGALGNVDGSQEGADRGPGHALLVGSDIAPREVKYSGAAPWRWLVSAVGGMLERGDLGDW